MARPGSSIVPLRGAQAQVTLGGFFTSTGGIMKWDFPPLWDGVTAG